MLGRYFISWIQYFQLLLIIVVNTTQQEGGGYVQGTHDLNCDPGPGHSVLEIDDTDMDKHTLCPIDVTECSLESYIYHQQEIGYVALMHIIEEPIH